MKLTITEKYFLEQFKKRFTQHYHRKFELILAQQQIGYYRVDFLFPHKHLIVELDGVQHNEKINRANDIMRDNCLKEMGFDIIHYSNKEVYKNINNILNYIDMWACLENPIDNANKCYCELKRLNKWCNQNRNQVYKYKPIKCLP